MSSPAIRPASRWALVCHHDPDTASPSLEVTRWASRAEAIVARDTLAPCSRRCTGNHTVVRVDPDTPRPRRHPALLRRDHHAHKTLPT